MDREPAAFGFSSTADFYPEDEPEGFITWTFAVPKKHAVGAGLYELRFVRNLTAAEIANGVRPEDAHAITPASDGEVEAQPNTTEPQALPLPGPGRGETR